MKCRARVWPYHHREFHDWQEIRSCRVFWFSIHAREPTQSRSVVGTRHYQVPMRSTACVVTLTPSCGRIMSKSPIQVCVYCTLTSRSALEFLLEPCLQGRAVWPTPNRRIKPHKRSSPVEPAGFAPGFESLNLQRFRTNSVPAPAESATLPADQSAP